MIPVLEFSHKLFCDIKTCENLDDDQIHNKFNNLLAGLNAKYKERTDFSTKTFLRHSPNMLKKLLTVFPQNVNNEHWIVTFVSNAGNMMKSTGE